MTEPSASSPRPLNFGLYNAIRAIAWPLTHLYFTIRISGLDNLPPRGTPTIVTVNHSSTLDVYVTGYAVGRPAYFAAKEEITRWPVIGPLLTRMGAVPARRDRRDMDVVRLLKTALEDGGLAGLAPEGTRSIDGQVAPFDPGFAWLAIRSGAVVVPAAIHGARELMPKGQLLPRPGPIWLRFGEPMALAEPGSRPGREELAEAAETVRHRTIELLAELAEESGIPHPSAPVVDS